MSRFYIPVNDAEQWAQMLADPVKHWRSGYSARTLAYSWQEAQGFPSEVQAALETAEQFSHIELLLGLPEHKVALPGGSRSSQNDIWVLARAGANLVSIAVEGKVAESFDKTVEEWLADGSPGKTARLDFLRARLGLEEPVPGAVRYQLLHRTASALIEAERFGASHAVMLVHSFSPAQEWFQDYAAFAELFGLQVKTNRMAYAGCRNGTHLHLCWVCGDERYLGK